MEVGGLFLLQEAEFRELEFMLAVCFLLCQKEVCVLLSSFQVKFFVRQLKAPVRFDFCPEVRVDLHGQVFRLRVAVSALNICLELDADRNNYGSEQDD